MFHTFLVPESLITQSPKCLEYNNDYLNKHIAIILLFDNIQSFFMYIAFNYFSISPFYSNPLFSSISTLISFPFFVILITPLKNSIPFLIDIISYYFFFIIITFDLLCFCLEHPGSLKLELSTALLSFELH